jgi:hypothetical protein
VKCDLPVLFFNYLKFKQSTLLDVQNFFRAYSLVVLQILFEKVFSREVGRVTGRG